MLCEPKGQLFENFRMKDKNILSQIILTQLCLTKSSIVSVCFE